MKGLLVKDLQIMLIQRKFLLLVLGIAFFMGLTMEDTSFLTGYIIFMCSILVLSTISYDDFDNGYTFLFTLPVTKKGYVLEKYALTVLIGIISWTISTALYLVISFVKMQPMEIGMMILSSTMVLVVCFIMIFIMLPLQMKFGAEKSRIVMVSIIGIGAIIGYLCKMAITKFPEKFVIYAENIVAKVSAWSEMSILLGMSILAIIVMGITMLISFSVMEKKQL